MEFMSTYDSWSTNRDPKKKKIFEWVKWKFFESSIATSTSVCPNAYYITIIDSCVPWKQK